MIIHQVVSIDGRIRYRRKVEMKFDEQITDKDIHSEETLIGLFDNIRKEIRA